MPKRKDGRYYARVDTDQKGKDRYKDIYGKSQKMADEKALELIVKIKKGLNIEAQRDSWGQWSDKWFATKEGCSRGQNQNYEIGAKHFESLRNRKIAEIRSSDIKEIIILLAKKAAMIMMYSGLRRGELIPLTWNDIDLKKKTIRVNKSVELFNGKPELKSGAKSVAGARTINIPKKLVDYLKAQPRDNLLVCPSASGTMMSGAAWRALWKSYIKELNLIYGKNIKTTKSKYAHAAPQTIPPITAHWLRHTFATLLYLSGVDVLTAKDQLGHADVKTTLNIYTHLDNVYKDKNIVKLDSYLDAQLF